MSSVPRDDRAALGKQGGPVSNERLSEWLSTPEAYPERPQRVEIVETHISRVFLTDRYVYKLKKPVRFDFVDFTTLAARHAACEDELRLNRRLAPDVYLAVVPITLNAGGRLELDGAGSPVEWLVKMRRLPAERMLNRLIADSRLDEADLGRLADFLARFYASAAPLQLDPNGYRRQRLGQVRDNRRELLADDLGLPRALVKRIHAAQILLLELVPSLVEERVAAGRIIDGHGDLRPEHVVLADPPAVFDCVEFNALLRRNDAADELSFLAMECDRLGAPEVGERVFEAYCRASGDQPSLRLLDFYKAYRACVRAKVTALRARQLPAAATGQVLADAERYLALADDYLRATWRPEVLVVRGVTGSGKSTLARNLADVLGAELLQTDVLRRELLRTSRSDTGLNEGIYRPELRAAVYREMFRRAAELLDERLPVVLDATFLGAGMRAEALEIARHHNAWLAMVRCHCPPELALSRIADRRARGDDASEARPELHALHRGAEEPDELEVPKLEVDTAGPPEVQLDKVIAWLRLLYRATLFA